MELYCSTIRDVSYQNGEFRHQEALHSRGQFIPIEDNYLTVTLKFAHCSEICE